jgi:hypothetical protein
MRTSGSRPLFLGYGWYTRDCRGFYFLVVLCQGDIFPMSSWARHCDAGDRINDAAVACLGNVFFLLILVVKVVCLLHKSLRGRHWRRSSEEQSHAGEETLRGRGWESRLRGFWRVEMDFKVGNCRGFGWCDDYGGKPSLLGDRRA